MTRIQRARAFGVARAQAWLGPRMLDIINRIEEVCRFLFEDDRPWAARRWRRPITKEQPSWKDQPRRS
jgi:hypothetical protein